MRIDIREAILGHRNFVTVMTWNGGRDELLTAAASVVRGINRSRLDPGPVQSAIPYPTITVDKSIRSVPYPLEPESAIYFLLKAVAAGLPL